MIGKIGLPMRFAAWLGAIAAVSTATAGTLQLTAAGLAFGEGTAQKAKNRQAVDSSSGAKDTARMQKELKKTSAAFMENRGQWNKDALYLAQSPNLNLWVTREGLRSEYYGTIQQKDSTLKVGQVVDMSFEGARALTHKASGRHPAITQFIKPSGTKTVSSYDEVKLSSLYKGIDLKLYNEDGRPRYDLVVAPGADPGIIKMRFRGADSVGVNKEGGLVLGTQKGLLEHRGLFAYQVKNGNKVQVPAKFEVVGKDRVRFNIGAYDKSRELIVDPIVYGTYFGGDTGIDEVRAVTSDADAGVFFTGSTQAPDFPILFGPFSFNITGPSDVFLAKLRGDAYIHEYSAYIGGTANETGKFIALDPSGNTVWIAGMTTSTNFPGMSGSSLQGTRNGTIDMFLVAFTRHAKTVLEHSYSTYFGSGGAEELTGFGISPSTGNLVLYGHMGNGLPSASNAYPGAANANAFLVSLTPDGQSIVFSKYHGGTANQYAGLPTSFHGSQGPQGLITSMNQGLTGVSANATSRLTSNALAVDAIGNIVITGTVAFSGNQDTGATGTPAYPTTAGVFPNGRILRSTDAFVAKFNESGLLIYSAVLGGANTDYGSGVAVDESGNAYLTGIAGSFDFPRTSGTYGQTFTNAANVFVTKLNFDSSNIIWSTNLRTASRVYPTGIAVNQRGFSFITGIVDAGYQYANPLPDPIEPNANTGVGAIQTTPDAIRATYTFPATPELPTTDGFLNIIDSEAANLLYGTYVGGLLDDIAFAPYVDRIGDVWVMGYTNSQRDYYPPVIMANPPPKRHQPPTGSAGLDAGFITPLAFKSNVQPGGVIDFPPNTIFDIPLYFQDPPFLLPVAKFQDGYLFRFRLDIPLVSNLTLAPSSIAGGLGQTSTGTVTISGPAPAEGVSVVVTLNNTTAASLSAGGPVSQTTVTIPAGETTGTFTVHTSPVIDPTQVSIKAEYLGSFQIRILTVNPWLSQLTLNPTTVASGNQSTGRVTLFSVATQNVQVALTTDNPDLISFPGGNTVTVPAGQQAANFQIQTSTVDTQQQGNISASFLGKTRTQVLAVRPAIIDTLSFVPNRVAGGGSAIGTVTLDGNAPSTGAEITLSAITNPGFIGSLPPSVTIPAGQRSATFTVVTTLVPSNTFSVIRATYNATNRDATLLIDNIALSNFTLSPTTVNGGANTTGTVTLNQPAPPGGAFVNISSASPSVNIPDEDPNTPGNQVLVAANNTARSFTIGTVGVLALEVATISAERGGAPINRDLTINPVNFTISINPNSVLGGDGATLTITLTGPAPAGGVPFAITKLHVSGANNTGAVTVNGGNPVAIAGGQTSAQFPVTTASVAATGVVGINAKVDDPGNSNNHTANLTVRAPRVVGISFSPSVVRGLFTTNMTVTLDGPAPAGGAVVSLSKTPNPQIVNLPATVTVAAGQTTFSQVITTNKVSRTLATNVTASYGGNTANALLTVTR